MDQAVVVSAQQQHVGQGGRAAVDPVTQTAREWPSSALLSAAISPSNWVPLVSANQQCTPLPSFGAFVSGRAGLGTVCFNSDGRTGRE